MQLGGGWQYAVKLRRETKYSPEEDSTVGFGARTAYYHPPKDDHSQHLTVHRRTIIVGCQRQTIQRNPRFAQGTSLSRVHHTHHKPIHTITLETYFHWTRMYRQVHHGMGPGLGGTGLGLAISKSLCEYMGGGMRCTSKPGQGSVFRFCVLLGVETSYDDAGTKTPADQTGSGCDSTDTATLDATAVTALSECKVPDTGPEEPAPFFRREWNMAVEGGQPLTENNVQDGPRDASQRGSFQAQLSELEEMTGPGAAAQGGNDPGRRRFATQADSSNLAIRCTGDPTAASIPGASSHLCFAGAKTAAEGPGRHTPATRRPDVVGKRPRILVADDVRVNRMLVGKMLQPLDVDVEFVEDGAKAVEICRWSKFDIILMDVMMPVMGGLEATTAIRSEDGGVNKTTPIIAATGSVTLHEKNESDEAGITDVLVKPITRKSLFAKIAVWATEENNVWMRDASMRNTTKPKLVNNEDKG